MGINDYNNMMNDTLLRHNSDYSELYEYNKRKRQERKDIRQGMFNFFGLIALVIVISFLIF